MTAMSVERSGEVSVGSESDLVNVRKLVRDVAATLGFAVTDVARIVTAASELSRNILRYAGQGTMRWQALDVQGRRAIELTFVDEGPGIADIEQAMHAGYSTSRGLGMGLPGAKRLMDEFEIQSAVGRGTTVVVRKWLRKG